MDERTLVGMNPWEASVDNYRNRPLTDEELLGIRAEVEAAERRVSGTLEPGVRGLVIAVVVLVLIVAMVLPYAGAASGWDVLLYDTAAKAEAVTLPMRLFAGAAVLFGVIASAVAVLTRRWVLAWVACLGCGLTSFFGLLAVWSRQTLLHPAGGPGVGLFLAWASAVVLTVLWIRLVWSRVGVPTR